MNTDNYLVSRRTVVLYTQKQHWLQALVDLKRLLQHWFHAIHLHGVNDDLIWNSLRLKKHKIDEGVAQVRDWTPYLTRGRFHKFGHTAQSVASNFWKAFCSIKVGRRRRAQMESYLFDSRLAPNFYEINPG